MRGGGASYPGKPSWREIECRNRFYKTDFDYEILKRGGAKGWQIYG